jgi:hypothetical protein
MSLVLSREQFEVNVAFCQGEAFESLISRSSLDSEISRIGCLTRSRDEANVPENRGKLKGAAESQRQRRFSNQKA